jgi:hypothetical protein
MTFLGPPLFYEIVAGLEIALSVRIVWSGLR